MYIAILSFLAFITIGAAIRCYECNSHNKSMCLDPHSYDKESLQKYLRTTNCEEGVLSNGHRQLFCRKIVQTILHKHHDSEVRVSRGCGWIQHPKDCYKADNEDHLETVCQCFTDDCNAGPTITCHWALIIALIALGFKMTLN